MGRAELLEPIRRARRQLQVLAREPRSGDGRSVVQYCCVKLQQVPRAIRRGLNGLTFTEGRAAFRHGVLPTFEHQPILRALRPLLVVDVGANRGQFSLDVRRAVPSARVVAFEPLGPEADIYCEIFANTPTYSLHRVALAAADGSASLHVSAARDSSSLLPIGERQSEIFPGTQEVSTEIVDVRTLDHFMDEFRSGDPALLKIDVQGAELDVFAGRRSRFGCFGGCIWRCRSSSCTKVNRWPTTSSRSCGPEDST